MVSSTGRKAHIHPASINARVPTFTAACKSGVELIGYQDMVATAAAANNPGRCNPNLSQFNPNLSQFNPNLSQFSPNLSQLNPNLSQLNPNLSQLNPNLSQLNPNRKRVFAYVEYNSGEFVRPASYLRGDSRDSRGGRRGRFKPEELHPNMAQFNPNLAQLNPKEDDDDDNVWEEVDPDSSSSVLRLEMDGWLKFSMDRDAFGLVAVARGELRRAFDAYLCNPASSPGACETTQPSRSPPQLTTPSRLLYPPPDKKLKKSMDAIVNALCAEQSCLG